MKRLKVFICLLFCLILFSNNALAGEEEPNNVVGINVGYFVPDKSDFEDYYDDSVFPVFAFYERRIYNIITADIEAGFLQEKGRLLTLSDEPTRIESKLTMVPVSASLKINQKIIPFVTGYIGIGPDYWYCREKTDAETENNKIEEWVGGYHGKIGFKLHNTDDQFKNTGAIIECVYSVIDRNGDNDLDIGGLTAKIGFFYQF